MQRTAFFISDSTGITAETLGRSLLAHFDSVQFTPVILSYVDNIDKAQRAVERINRAASNDGYPPIIFDTVVDSTIRNIIADSQGFIIDIISTFLSPLENALGVKGNFNIGRPQNATADQQYNSRIEAINYALENDDGAVITRYDQAQLILVGVSRSGKTPSSLYLALQAGIYVANYPLTDEDLDRNTIPRALQPHRDKLFGLTINPNRLSAIRNERRANSRYASLTCCEDEVRLAEAFFSRYKIPFIDTTHRSIEEIATKILIEKGLRG